MKTNKFSTYADPARVIPLQVDVCRPLLIHDGRMNVDSDISLLLNEKRLENNASVIAELKNRFSERSSSSSPFDGLDDDAIFEATCPRSFQSQSERSAWLDYYTRNIDRNITALKESFAKQEETKKEEVVETKSD